MNQVITIPYGEGSRWVVVDEHHPMINPIMKYIKYLDQIGRSANTLKSYAYQLKVYWDFLKDIQQSYENMDLNLLAKFMAWLRNPMPIDKVSYIEATTAKRRETLIKHGVLLLFCPNTATGCRNGFLRRKTSPARFSARINWTI